MEFYSFNPQLWSQLQVNCVIQRQDHKTCQVPTWVLPCDLGRFSFDIKHSNMMSLLQHAALCNWRWTRATLLILALHCWKSPSNTMRLRSSGCGSSFCVPQGVAGPQTQSEKWGRQVRTRGKAWCDVVGPVFPHVSFPVQHNEWLPTGLWLRPQLK